MTPQQRRYLKYATFIIGFGLLCLWPRFRHILVALFYVIMSILGIIGSVLEWIRNNIWTDDV